MRRLSSAVQVVLLVLCTLSLVPLGHAQYRASIQGVVTDSTGAVVPGATVTITDRETNRTLTATSDANGIYNLSGLPPSTYTVKAEKTGFKKKEIAGYTVIAEQANSLDLQLEVGQSSETVNVSADAIPAIDTETAQISGSVDSKHIQSMPSFGRDIFQLAQLAPGVFGDGSQNGGGGAAALPGNAGPGSIGAASGPFQTENRPQVTANGGRTDQNNITIDGIGVTSVSWGGASVVTPNEDSVKELKVVANNYDAENGRFGNGQIQVITQNGTNQYHGSLFFKRDSPGLNAYQHWNGTADNTIAPLRNNNQFNDWGGSVGGPIIKNKLFAFFSYERISNTGTSQSQGWFETPQALALAPSGSIASAYASFPGEAVHYSTEVDQTCASIGLLDPAGAAALNSGGTLASPVYATCNELPGKGLDIGTPLNASAFPLHSLDPSFLPQQCYASGVGAPYPVGNCGAFVSGTTGPTYNTPITYRPGLGGDGTGGNATNSNLNGIPGIFDVISTGPNNSTNQQYNGRADFNATSKDLISFNIYKVPVSTLSYNGNRAANLFHHSAMNEAETALWDHTFSPSLINEVRLNGAGWRWNELAENPQIPLGLPQPAFIGDQSHGNQLAGISLDANGALGGPAGSIFDQWTINFKDVATKVYHAHTIKFGGEITRLKFVQDAPWSARPNFGFDNFWDFLNDATVYETGTFNPQNGVPTDVRKDVRANIWGFFVQDDWKLRPNLTVNLGMRWEYFGPISDLHGLLSTVVLGPGTGALTGMSMRTGGNLYNADKGDFGPRIGFAWSPSRFNSKLVVRAGFGINYTGEEEAITLNGWPNIPFDNGGSTYTSASTIVYAIPSNPLQFEPYPANPSAILTFGPNNIPTSGAPASVTAFPANFHTTYTYNYSLDTSYDLGHAWVASLGYQGAAAHHLTLQNNLNLIYGNAGLALNPFINNVDNYAQIGNSNFNAMLAEVKHNFARSFDIDAQYRWSHSLDEGSQPYAVPNFQWNPATAYGASDFNVTNAFKLWGVYSPTIFHGSNGWLEKVAGNWSLSGIMNWHDGFPWSPYFYGTCNMIYANGACTNGGTTQLLPGQYLGGAGTDYSNSRFLSAGGNFPNGGSAYFVAPTVTACTATFPNTCPGTAPQAPGFGRNSLRGPGYFDLDATISKGFGLPKAPILGEGARLEFRANFYNLTNKLNLTSIDTGVTDAHFGEATSALGSRTIELQARFSF